ncbi:MAG: nitroreductase family protein [Omnitrophica WOR_2 bacterium]
MDTFQTIKTMRSVRYFLDQPLPEEVLERILQAGRWTGSAKNTQPWQFIVVKNHDTLTELSKCGAYASHLSGAALAVVIVMPVSAAGSFDAGRAAQNMMLAAWADGVGSCIASLNDQTCTGNILNLPPNMRASAAISFGYPQPDAPRMIEGHPMQEVLASLGRRPLAEIVHWEKW